MAAAGALSLGRPSFSVSWPLGFSTATTACHACKRSTMTKMHATLARQQPQQEQQREPDFA